MKSSCAFLALLEKLERWIIPMTALQLGTRFPWFALQRRHPNSLRCLLDCSMLWHASAAHLQSLPSRACCTGTKHSGGRGTHVKLSPVCCGFSSQNALRKKHKVRHASRHGLINSFFLMHASEAQLWIRINCYNSTSHSFNLRVLTVGNPAHNPACPRMRYTLFDCVKTNRRCLLKNLLPQNAPPPPASVLFHIWWCWLWTLQNLFFLPLCSLFYSASLVISQKKTKQTRK